MPAKSPEIPRRCLGRVLRTPTPSKAVRKREPAVARNYKATNGGLTLQLTSDEANIANTYPKAAKIVMGSGAELALTRMSAGWNATGGRPRSALAILERRNALEPPTPTPVKNAHMWFGAPRVRTMRDVYLQDKRETHAQDQVSDWWKAKQEKKKKQENRDRIHQARQWSNLILDEIGMLRFPPCPSC